MSNDTTCTNRPDSVVRPNCVVISLGEMTLKGRNYNRFRNRLVKNASAVLRAHGISWRLKPIYNRLVVEIPESEADGTLDAAPGEEKTRLGRCLTALARVPGIVGTSPRLRIRQHQFLTSDKQIRYELLEEPLIRIAQEVHEPGLEFVVRVNRADRWIKGTSQQIERRLGRTVIERTGWEKVNLKKPGRTFYVDLHTEGAYIGVRKNPGIGGLPVGTSGHVMSLLSGGIDSPVASFLMIKRGCRTDFVHFTADPVNLRMQPEENKIVRMVRQLSEYAGEASLWVIPETQFDLALLGSDTPYKLLLFRRFMTRCAERLAQRGGGAALVVGDSLGQVASQTLENVISNSSALDIPILRPLIGYDKDEIVHTARRIGTYDLSIEAYKDCCAMIARKARTRSTHAQLQELEDELLPNYEEVIARSIADATVVDFELGKIKQVTDASARNRDAEDEEASEDGEGAADTTVATPHAPIGRRTQ